MKTWLAAALLCAAVSPAWALDYLSAGDTAVMFDGPSDKARPQRILARGTPVERVVVLGAWIKVRDPKGIMGWVEKSLLSERRMVMVRASGRATVRGEASDQADLVFEAEPEVLLELIEPASAGWARVRHVDGQSGFVRATQVWGL